jgi:hypothetical protein
LDFVFYKTIQAIKTDKYYLDILLKALPPNIPGDYCFQLDQDCWNIFLARVVSDVAEEGNACSA